MMDYVGQFMWYDLMTDDPASAMAFYGRVAGWGTQLWAGGAQPYTMWTVRGEPLGGVMGLPEEARRAGTKAYWLAYIGTDDAARTLSRAQELQAQVLVPVTEIPGVGRFAVIADPQGAVVAIFTPNGPPMAPPEPGPGRIAWHELIANDREAAFSFYSALFGWEKTGTTDMGEYGLYQMFGKGGRSVGGMWNRPAGAPGRPLWLYYITVPEIRSALDLVTSNGGQILSGPMALPGGGHVAQCRDPQGAMFALHTTA